MNHLMFTAEISRGSMPIKSGSPEHGFALTVESSPVDGGPPWLPTVAIGLVVPATLASSILTNPGVQATPSDPPSIEEDRVAGITYTILERAVLEATGAIIERLSVLAGKVPGGGTLHATTIETDGAT